MLRYLADQRLTVFFRHPVLGLNADFFFYFLVKYFFRLWCHRANALGTNLRFNRLKCSRNGYLRECWKKKRIRSYIFYFTSKSTTTVSVVGCDWQVRIKPRSISSCSKPQFTSI